MEASRGDRTKSPYTFSLEDLSSKHIEGTSIDISVSGEIYFRKIVLTCFNMDPLISVCDIRVFGRTFK